MGTIIKIKVVERIKYNTNHYTVKCNLQITTYSTGEYETKDEVIYSGPNKYEAYEIANSMVSNVNAELIDFDLLS